MPSVGTLTIDLRAETASVSKALKGLSSLSAATAKDIQRSFKIVGTAIVAAGVAATTALAGLIIKSAQSADELSKMSQRVGVSVEDLSALKHAADLSGVGFEGLATGLGKLAKNMNDAAQGTGTAKRAFQQLGVDVKNTDGSLRDQRDVLLDLADKFAKLGAGARSTALAQEIFGKSGKDLLPLLFKGRDGIAEMTAEAERLGLVISTKTAQAAEEFNDNLQRLGSVVTGLGNKLLAELAPSLELITKRMVEAAGSGELLEGTLANLKSFALKAVIVFGVLQTEINLLLLGLKKTAEQFALFAKGDFAGALKVNVSAFKEARQIIEEAAAGIRRLLHPDTQKLPAGFFPDPGEFQSLKKNAKESGEAIGELGKSMLEALPISSQMEEAIEGINTRLEQQRDTVEELLKARSGKAVPVPQIILPSADLSGLDDFFASLTKSIQEGAKSMDDWKKAGEEVRRAVDPIAAATDDYATEIERLNELLARGEIDFDTYGKAAERAGRELDIAKGKTFDLKEAARDLGRDLGATFKQAIFHAKSFRDVLFAVLQDVINFLGRLFLDKLGLGGGGGGFLGFLGSILGGLFGGGHAAGGRVNPNQFSLVGEKGPELFVPDTSGMIVPNNQLAFAGGGMTSNFFVDARGADVGAEQRVRRGLQLTHKASVREAVHVMQELRLRRAT